MPKTKLVNDDEIVKDNDAAFMEQQKETESVVVVDEAVPEGDSAGNEIAKLIFELKSKVQAVQDKAIADGNTPLAQRLGSFRDDVLALQTRFIVAVAPKL